MRKLLLALICLVPLLAQAQRPEFDIINRTSDILVMAYMPVPPGMGQMYTDLNTFGNLVPGSNTMHVNHFQCKNMNTKVYGTFITFYVDEKVGVTEIKPDYCIVDGVKYNARIEPGIWGRVIYSNAPIQK